MKAGDIAVFLNSSTTQDGEGLIEDIATQYLPWFCFGCSAHKGLNYFFLSEIIQATTPVFLDVKIWKLGSFSKKNQIFLSTGFRDIWLQT